jgi:sulfur-oxidizing protein SoxX
VIVVSRDGNCLLCHSIPETGEQSMGNVAPPLSRVASRLSQGQLRLRVVDAAERCAKSPHYRGNVRWHLLASSAEVIVTETACLDAT